MWQLPVEVVSTHAPLAGSDELDEILPVSKGGFNPRSPCGERPGPSHHTRSTASFNPRSPCGERRRLAHLLPRRLQVSTHAPLAGSDPEWKAGPRPHNRFQPTLPLRGATLLGKTSDDMYKGFNPRSPCGERRQTVYWVHDKTSFNPRSPCGERRREGGGRMSEIEFQPTLPLRGATSTRLRTFATASRFQPTLPLRGATVMLYALTNWDSVSTHAPLAGSDSVSAHVLPHRAVSTHAPLAGSDLSRQGDRISARVSTHAPLAGSDHRAQHGRWQPQGVSTHAPLAGSDFIRCLSKGQMMFQPTLPLRGATTSSGASYRSTPWFQPTLPLRGATVSEFSQFKVLFQFQPTLPLRGSDARIYNTDENRVMFQPTLPLRGATNGGSGALAPPKCFNPRSPCGERRPPSSDTRPT